MTPPMTLSPTATDKVHLRFAACEQTLQHRRDSLNKIYKYIAIAEVIIADYYRGLHGRDMTVATVPAGMQQRGLEGELPEG
jgi:hypothetical protein